MLARHVFSKEYLCDHGSLGQKDFFDSIEDDHSNFLSRLIQVQDVSRKFGRPESIKVHDCSRFGGRTGFQRAGEEEILE